MTREEEQARFIDAGPFMVSALVAGRKAVKKMQREYKQLQPDAAPGECWYEVEAFAMAMEEALDLASGIEPREA